MNENQYLRWGIPGWVFFIVVISYWIITPDFAIITFKDLNMIAPITFIIGAGIPFGFIIYQIYFAVTWAGFLPHSDVPRKTIIGVPNSPDLGDIYDHRREWPIVENFWYKKIYELGFDKAGFLRDRHYHMVATLHALGSTMTSIFLGNIC